MNSKTRELIDTLLAISVVSKRLAANLAKTNYVHEDRKQFECPCCRFTETVGNAKEVHNDFIRN